MSASLEMVVSPEPHFNGRHIIEWREQMERGVFTLLITSATPENLGAARRRFELFKRVPLGRRVEILTELKRSMSPDDVLEPFSIIAEQCVGGGQSQPSLF